MGYESKLYVVEKTDVFDDEKRYGRVLAMFDMKKFSFLSDALRECPETDCYFYADDGDTRVLEDRYGKPLTETSVEYVSDILRGALAEKPFGDWYRVYGVLEYLKALYSPYKKNIVVLHYGY